MHVVRWKKRSQAGDWIAQFSAVIISMNFISTSHSRLSRRNIFCCLAHNCKVHLSHKRVMILMRALRKKAQRRFWHSAKGFHVWRNLVHPCHIQLVFFILQITQLIKWMRCTWTFSISLLIRAWMIGFSGNVRRYCNESLIIFHSEEQISS